MDFLKKVDVHSERKRPLKVAGRVHPRLYRKLRLLKMSDDEFVKLAKHSIFAVLHHRYLYFDHYISRLRERKVDVLLPSLELLKVPYKLQLLKIHYSLEDVEVVLHLFAHLEKELKEILHQLRQ